MSAQRRCICLLVGVCLAYVLHGLELFARFVFLVVFPHGGAIQCRRSQQQEQVLVLRIQRLADADAQLVNKPCDFASPIVGRKYGVTGFLAATNLPCPTHRADHCGEGSHPRRVGQRLVPAFRNTRHGHGSVLGFMHILCDHAQQDVAFGPSPIHACANTLATTIKHIAASWRVAAAPLRFDGNAPPELP